MATKGQTRVARPLAVVLLVLIGLYSLVFWKDWEPKLGLDLRGGTSVTLTPDRAKSPDVSGASLDKAVDIIRNRVNGTGVAESEVVREGENILVALPDVGRDQALRLVGQTAQLRFRKVLNAAAGSPTPAVTATPSAPVSGTPTPSRTATPTVRPSASASASPAARSRALGQALLGQVGTPTPSPTATGRGPTGTPTPTGTPRATPAPAPTTPLTPAALQALFATVDCTKPADLERIRGADDPNQQIVSCDQTGEAKYLLDVAAVVGSDVSTATETVDTAGAWQVELRLTSEGRKKFGDLTAATVNQQIAIVLDGIVQSAPTVSQAIPDGIATITGDFDKKEAQDLANVLKYGALPLTFDQSQTQTITPTLGEDQLNAGMLAGVLGLIAVFIYGVLYYRGLGLVTVLGLLIFAALNYAMVVILGNSDVGFTLTLAGIAGLIVSTGISADSYVVFYERLKDEVHEGRSLRAGVDRGFARAFRTILAADFVSFLAAGTLYVLSVGAVRGFAFTLGLATLIDVFVAWFFTRPMVSWLTRTRLFSEGRFIGIRSAVTSPREA